MESEQLGTFLGSPLLEQGYELFRRGRNWVVEGPGAWSCMQISAELSWKAEIDRSLGQEKASRNLA